jgi:hypothetical protein
MAVMLAIGTMAGCAHKEEVRVDLDSFMSNQAAYADKRVTITAGIDDIVQRFELYRGKQVEVAAPVSYYGRLKYWTWYLTLEEQGKQLRCYTHHYRLSADRFAIMMLKQAMYAKAPITVVGRVFKDGLDIVQMMYDGSVIRPDLKARDAVPFGWEGSWGWGGGWGGHH